MPETELIQVMHRVEELLRYLVRLQTGPVLQAELGNDFEKRLYDLTGKATSREIQKELECGPNRISETWNRWEQLGLVVKDGKSYRKVV